MTCVHHVCCFSCLLNSNRGFDVILLVQTTMFGRRAHADARKSAVKVSETKRETVTRLRHLRTVLGTFDCAQSLEANNYK